MALVVWKGREVGQGPSILASPVERILRQKINDKRPEKATKQIREMQ